MTISFQDWLATVQLMDQNTNAAFAITCGWQSRGNEWNHQVSFASHDLDFMNLVSACQQHRNASQQYRNL